MLSGIGSALVNGLAAGMLLFLVAIGLSLIFGVMDILNFAHGSLYMLGAYFMYFSMNGSLPFGFFEHFIVAIITAAVLVGIVGGLLERLTIRPIYDAPHAIQLLLTFALVLALDGAARFFWGTHFRTIRIPEILSFQVSAGGATLPGYSLFVIVLGISVAIGMWAIFELTNVGKIVRAAAHHRETANAMGINVPLVFTGMFVFGSVLAGLAGALTAPWQAVHSDMGLNIIVDSFIVVVIGGLGSFKGTFVAALIIGLSRSFIFMVDPRLVGIIPFILMAVILLLMPRGIFGEAEV